MEVSLLFVFIENSLNIFNIFDHFVERKAEGKHPVSNIFPSRPVWAYVRVGPVPGLEVAPESIQVDRGEVGTDTFPQPPLSLSCTGAARLAELIPEVFSSDPPGKEKKKTQREDVCSGEEEENERASTWVSIRYSGLVGKCQPSSPWRCGEFDSEYLMLVKLHEQVTFICIFHVCGLSLPWCFTALEGVVVEKRERCAVIG